jgi:cold shock protein
MPSGTVVRFERNSGFGFIRDTEGQEIFVHHTDLGDRSFLIAGQKVEFAVQHGARGPRAVDVVVTRDVPLKRQRHLDWRGRRGKAPRPGDLPSSGPKGETPEEAAVPEVGEEKEA